MRIDFNNVRRQACISYDKLCRKLNDARCDEANGDWIDGYGRVDKGTIIIEPEQLDDVMNDLRMMIGSIASSYLEGDAEVANVYDELYPENSEKRMAEFNPEPE